MQAVMMFEIFINEALRIGDCKITGLTRKAAQLHGFETEEDMLNHSVWLSCHQDETYRKAGQWAWYCRHHGLPAPKEYATVMRGPDGAPIGQRRKLVQTLVGPHGRVQFLTAIEKVGQLPEAPVPDLTSTHTSMEDWQDFCGEFTIDALKKQYAAGCIVLPHSKTLTNILSVCAGLSTNIFDLTPDKAVDIAFSDLVSWTLSEHAQHPVLVKYTCGGEKGCGRQWQAWSPRETMRCPSCARYVAHAAALA